MSRLTAFALFIRQALLYPLTSPFLPPPEKVLKDFSYAAGQKVGTLVIPPAQGLPKTGQTIKYKTGDDGDFEAGYPETPPRFVDNGDGTISDLATGLMWIKDPSQLGGIWGTPGSPATMNWDNAVEESRKLDHAGHTDWRLSNLKELISIADYSLSGPSINGTFFPNTQSNPYWSSTTYISLTNYAWDVSFFKGTGAVHDKITSYYARPVRGGPHESPEE